MTSERTGHPQNLDASSAFLSSSRASVAQAAAAVVLSGLSYLVLLLVQDRLGPRVSYRGTFFVQWTQYVCVLLAFWALCILFTKWLRSRRSAQALAKTPVPDLDALSTDEGTRELIGRFHEAATLSGDHFLASRAEKLIQEFRLTNDSTAVAAALTLDSEAAHSALESDYAAVRIFSWTIPVLGFVGTVLGIGQALGRFATFLATSAQASDEIKPALARATTDLGLAFETTLIAVLLTMIVAAFYLLIHQREQNLLSAADEVCRSRLLPLMRVIKAPQPGISPPAERSETDSKWISEFDKLLAELTEAHGQSLELGRQYLEQGRAANQDVSRLLNTTDEFLTAQRETLAAILEALKSSAGAAGEAGRPDVKRPRIEGVEQLETFGAGYGGNGHPRDAGQLAGQPQMDIARASLEELRETIREISPVLRRLAEHLREHAEGSSHPISIRFPSARSASAGTD